VRHQRNINDAERISHGIIFDDTVEMLDMVCEAGHCGQFWRHMGDSYTVFGSRGRDLMKWLGREDLRGWRDLREKCKLPWKPGEERVKRLLATLERQPFIPPRDLRRKSVWRDNEGDFDLDRFCEGREAYRGPRRREVIGRQFLTFVVDVAAGHMTSADSMYWRAAVTIAVAKTLEEYGYGVEVLAVSNILNMMHPHGRAMIHCDADDLNRMEEELFFKGKGPPPKYRFVPPGEYQDVFSAVWIKRPDDPIDVGAMAAACSPWFFRLVFFGLWGLVPNCVPRSGLGLYAGIDPKAIDDWTGTPAGERVVLSNVWDEKRAVELMRATLRNYADPEWLADQPAERRGSL
jgi:hypothetical protein